MKVGDLVRFKEIIIGCEDMIGTVVDTNGPESFVVFWNKRSDTLPPAWRKALQTELSQFLEVVSEI